MKIFNFHDNEKRRINYRPYYRGTWEPLLMDSRHILPFQYYDTGSPQIFHVTQGGAATEITSYFEATDLTEHTDYFSYNGGMLNTALPLGLCRFVSQGGSNLYTDDCLVVGGSDYVMSPSDYISSSVLLLQEDVIGIKVQSNIDFGNTYYRGGWFQFVWKRGTISRAPAGKVVITGDERDGRLIKESIVTATKFTMSFKTNENEYEGFLEALPGIWSAYDKSGRVYSMNNIEIQDPEVYQNNMILRINFEDNISKFSYNNSEL